VAGSWTAENGAVGVAGPLLPCGQFNRSKLMPAFSERPVDSQAGFLGFERSAGLIATQMAGHTTL